jgi:hypothetical protein
MRRAAILIALLLLSILAAWPLITYGPPLQMEAITDGPNHLYRAALLARHIQHGDFYPRWFSDLHYGFGAPVLNYYAPLSYYLLVGIYAFIPALPVAFQWGFILALTATVFGSYFWLKEQFDSEAAGLAGAAAYAFTPYIYFSSLERAAYPELWGLALAPWVFCSVLRFAQAQSFGRRIAFVLLYAALILTHNLSALLFTPILLAYAAILVWQPTANRLKRLGLFAASAAQSVALAAFFILPFLIEAPNVHFERTAEYDYAANFSTTADLFSLPIPFDPQHVSHGYPASIPWPQLALAVIGLGLVMFLPNGNSLRAIALLFIGISALLIFLNLRISLPVWDVMPLATSIQFPFRLLGPVILLLAWLTAACVAQATQQRQTVIALCVVTATFFFTLTWTYHDSFDSFPNTLRPQDIIEDEIAHPTRFGTTNLAEFVPRWVTELPPADTLLPRYAESDSPSRLVPLPESVAVITETTTLTRTTLAYNADSPFMATYNIFYFPDWQVTLDGAHLELKISEPNGLIQLDLPAGQHTVELALKPTPSKIAGGIISLLALAAFFIPVPRSKDETVQTTLSEMRGAWAIAGLLVVLVVARAAVLERIENPFYHFGLQHISHLVTANFDNQLTLLGYDLPNGSTVVSGESLEINLYWQAATQLTTDYHASIQLVNAYGNRFGQSDHQHPADVPTSQWQPGEYALDMHNLPSLAGTPPGEYRLVVTVYSDSPLTVRDADANPQGVEFDMGAITVIRGPSQAAGPLRLVDSSLASQTVGVGDSLLFTLVWTTGDTPTPDLSAQLTLRDQSGELLYDTTFAPAGPDYSSSQWQPNELIRYPHSLTLPPDLPAGPATAAITFMDATGSSVSESIPLGEITITVPERSFTVPPMMYQANYDFAETVRLLGYDISADSVTLYWQALQPISKRLTVFVHVLDEVGNFISGQDSPPVRTTTGWLPGEVITDVHPIAVGDQFEIGLYDSVTGERLGEAYLHSP